MKDKKTLVLQMNKLENEPEKYDEYINLIIQSYNAYIRNDKDFAIKCFNKIRGKLKYVLTNKKIHTKNKIKYLKIYLKENLRYILHNIKLYIKYTGVSLQYVFLSKRKFNIMENKETINKIVNEGYSLCRYGDGEFKWILGIKQNSFQEYSIELEQELREILELYSSKDKILIGINGTLNNLSEYNFNSKLYWKEFMVKYGKKIYPILPEIQYCDSNITRPYIDYKDKVSDIIIKRFNEIKEIWKNRNVIIVEGEYTRLGVGNDLFCNVQSIKRIICPAFNAYYKYKNIIEIVKEKAQKEDLILLSLGPTATIMSYKLSKEGYQCIDIGHIDIEYMWFKQGSKNKEDINGRFVNETSKDFFDETIDKDYKKQIIERI